MGCLRSITTKEVRKGNLMPVEIKSYSQSELYALNRYLKLRDKIDMYRDKSCPFQIIRVGKEYYIVRDDEGLDWMTRKEGNSYHKMFCLESWKRFSFGPKQPRYIRQRELKNEI